MVGGGGGGGGGGGAGGSEDMVGDLVVVLRWAIWVGGGTFHHTLQIYNLPLEGEGGAYFF